MAVYGVADVLRSLDRAVEAYGADYVDPQAAVDHRCRYTYEDGKHCLGGWILKDWGLDIPGVDAPRDDHNQNASILAANQVQITDEASGLLYETQRRQDDGNSWGRVRDMVTDKAEMYLVDAGLLPEPEAA